MILLFMCSFLKSEAKGREVTIFLKDSSEVKGELLAVRDSLVALAIEPIYSDEDIAAYPERVRIMRINSIENIHLTGNSIFLPTAVGAFGGLIAGSAIGFFNKEKGDNIPTTPLLGAILGIINGAVAGMFWSAHITYVNSDKQVTISEGLILLKEHSRFKESEPSYLRDTIDNLLKETK